MKKRLVELVLYATAVVAGANLLGYIDTADNFSDSDLPDQPEVTWMQAGSSSASSTAGIVLVSAVTGEEFEVPAQERPRAAARKPNA